MHELIDRVLAVRLTSGRTLSSELAISPVAERALRAALFGRRVHQPGRALDGGQIEFVVSLTRAELARMLGQIATEHLAPGHGARLRLDMQAAPVVATGRLAAGDDFGSSQPGWRHCSPRQVRLAAEAADVDLRRSVLTGVAQLPLTRRQTLAHVLATQPALREAIAAHIARLPASEPQFDPAGLCQKSLLLSHASMIHMVAGAAAEVGTVLDLSEVQLEGRDPLEFTGWAAPPP